MASVYMTVVGRSQDVTEAITESRAKLGVESSHAVLDGYDPSFVDFPFTDPDATFKTHLDRVRQTNPELTVAPDIENGRSIDSVIAQADRLSQHAETVVVVPKDVHPSEVPDRFRVGIPCADYGSGCGHSLWEYRDCGPVHLLGGGPARQLEVAKHVRVASVDTATLGKTCLFGYWHGKSMDAPDSWDYKKRLTASLNNYAKEWI